jgi:hypothetical protein
MAFAAQEDAEVRLSTVSVTVSRNPHDPEVVSQFEIGDA